MQLRRQEGLNKLKRLAQQKINNCMKGLSDRTLEEEIRQICTWVYKHGARSSLAEIQEQIESTKSKVREWLISSLPIMYFIHLTCFFLAGFTIQEEVIEIASIYYCSGSSFIKRPGVIPRLG